MLPKAKEECPVMVSSGGPDIRTNRRVYSSTLGGPSPRRKRRTGRSQAASVDDGSAFASICSKAMHDVVETLLCGCASWSLTADHTASSPRGASAGANGRYGPSPPGAREPLRPPYASEDLCFVALSCAWRTTVSPSVCCLDDDGGQEVPGRAGERLGIPPGGKTSWRFAWRTRRRRGSGKKAPWSKE